MMLDIFGSEIMRQYLKDLPLIGSIMMVITNSLIVDSSSYQKMDAKEIANWRPNQMTKPETKAKHTPGPWEAQACQVISLRNRFQVCDTYRGNKDDTRLIAAAPELL